MSDKQESVYEVRGDVAASRRPVSDDDIQREIFDAILEGRLPPGAKLGQDELGEVFGVSKTRIRPILHRLAELRIVILEPMRGAFVARPSVEEAREVNAARQIVEEGVIRAATRCAKRRDIRELRDLVAEERQARQDGRAARAHRLTGEFHCAIARITGNSVVAELVRDLVSRDSLVVALYQKPAQEACSLHGHSALVDLIAAGDEEAAAQAMRRHLQDVMASLDLGGDPVPRAPLREVFGRPGAA